MSGREEWDDRQDRFERSAGRSYDRFERAPWRTGTKWLIGIVAAALLIGAVVGVGNWIGAWGGEAKRIASPANVREQNTEILRDEQDMVASAGNACDVAAAGSKHEDGDPTLVEDPLVAYNATYRRIKADYDRRMGNLYEAQAVRGLPLPSNLRSLPKVAPTLKDRIAEVC